MDHHPSQRSTTSGYEPRNTSNPLSVSTLSDKLDIDEELRKLAQEQDDYHSRRFSPPVSPLRPAPLSFSHHTSPELQPLANADAQWGDPYANAYVSSPPMSSASFMSRGSAKSRGSHRATRKASTPARFEPDREGRPLDSMMTATTSPRPGSAFGFAPSLTSRTDRSLSIVPSITPAQDDQRSIPPSRDFEGSASIAPSIGPAQDDGEFSIQPSPTREHYNFEPSILEFNPTAGLDRNASIASNQTIPRSLFRDFDGVHVSPNIDADILEEEEEEEFASKQPQESNVHTDNALQFANEYEDWFQDQWQQAEGFPEEPDGVSKHGTEQRDLDGVQSVAEPQGWVEPPPPEGMQFYPAPVPRELNMPKRLSRQLPAEVMAKRRSQVLSTVNPDARMSAVWLPGDDEQPSEQAILEKEAPSSPAAHRRQKSSLANMKNLPPQLRASIFFDHQTVPHEIEMRGGSATATLENLLDASVSGPPANDVPSRHPDAVGRHKPRSSTLSLLDNGGRASRASMLSAPLTDKKSDGRLSRSSMLSGKRSQSFDNLAQAGNRSSAALSLSKFSFEEKRCSSALEIDAPNLRIMNGSEEGGEHGEEDELDDRRSSLRRSVFDAALSEGGVIHVEGEPVEEHEGEGGEEEAEGEEEAAQDSDEYDETLHGPPTTLLAELQLRKQKLKSRNRTAVSAFPNGMHSTLLEMDAVAQIEKRKRHKKPTTLAWEDPSARGTLADADDDDVPLGILFPARHGLIAKGKNEWDQPLGLLAKREQEESEPLSRRRNRLRGISPQRAIQIQREQQMQGLSPISPRSGVTEGQLPADGSDHEGETLAQRTRRLRSRRVLDDAIGRNRDGAQSRALSDDFAGEMMSTFGPLCGDGKPNDENSPQGLGPANDAEHEGETLGQRRKRLQKEAAARQPSGGRGEHRSPLRPTSSMANLLAQAPQSAFGVWDMSNETKTSGLIGDYEAKRNRSRENLLDQNYRTNSGMGVDQPLVDVDQDRAAAEKRVNRGAAGSRLSFAPGQFSGLGSKSSRELLREQVGTPQPQLNPSSQQQNPWAGFAPQSFAHGLGAVGSNLSPTAQTPPPFPQMPPHSGVPDFVADPKGGATHNVNRGSMLWSNEQSRAAQRQWSSGNFGAVRTYAAQAMGPQQMAFEQMQAANMSEMERAKIERWRTSIMPQGY